MYTKDTNYLNNVENYELGFRVRMWSQHFKSSQMLKHLDVLNSVEKDKCPTPFVKKYGEKTIHTSYLNKNIGSSDVDIQIWIVFDTFVLVKIQIMGRFVYRKHALVKNDMKEQLPKCPVE